MLQTQDVNMSSDIEIIETTDAKAGSQADRTEAKKESETRTPKVNKSNAGAKAKVRLLFFLNFDILLKCKRFFPF